MKKYVLVLNLVIFQLSLSAQTKYIDIAKASMLGTSTMSVYNGDKNLNDLKAHKLNIFLRKIFITGSNTIINFMIKLY